MTPPLLKSRYLPLLPDLLLLAEVRSIEGQAMIEGVIGSEGLRILSGITGPLNIIPG